MPDEPTDDCPTDEISYELVQGKRICPVCNLPMQQATVEHVTIDVCEEHGVWLDNGELEAIVELKIKRAKRRRSRVRGHHVRRRVKAARRQGRTEGALFGWWSLMLN